MLYKRVLALICVGAVAAVLSGCGVPTVVSGGGWLPSNNEEGGKANFGFWGDTCDDGCLVGHFNYHDMDGLVPKKYCIRVNGQKTCWWEDETVRGGVKMNGMVTEALLCVPNLENYDETACWECNKLLGGTNENGGDYFVLGWTAVKAHYVSTNPRARGDGELIACVKDNGEGSKADAEDQILIKALSGPFKGYMNEDDLSGGNIQQEECPVEPPI